MAGVDQHLETSNDMTYGGYPIPCSRAGVKIPSSPFSAIQLVTRCTLDQLAQLSRPADEQVRRAWMRRFTNEMHWLPLIEVLSGCGPDTDPDAHRAFAAALVLEAVPRVAHRPWGRRERLTWDAQLHDRIRRHCHDTSARTAVGAALVKLRDGDADVLFADDGCIAAAEKARPKCLSEPPWLLYKALTIVRGRLPDDEHRTLVMQGITGDPSSKAYCRCLEDGTW